MRGLVRNLLLSGAAVGVVLLARGPRAPGSVAKGSDDRACAAVGELRPGYRPWAAPLWAPPDAATERLLFGLQAALGIGGLGWAFARLRRGPGSGGGP